MRKNFISVFSFTGFLISIGFIWLFGFAVGGILIILMLMLIIIFWSGFEDKMLEIEFSSRIDDVIVAGIRENGEIPEIPGDMDFMFFWVENRKVRKEEERMNKLLERSGNELYCDGSLSDNKRLKVYGEIFRDGDRVNESWEEYVDYLIDKGMKLRGDRHRILKENDGVYYDEICNKQDGVVWDVKKT
jgi:hypothetical protein